MEDHVTVSSFSPQYYAKARFRATQAELSISEKVRQVVEMQRRLVPIYAQRGITIVPWKID